MTAKETELQREMRAMVQQTTALEEEFSGEKNRLAEELKSNKVSFSVTDSLHSDHSCAFSLICF